MRNFWLFVRIADLILTIADRVRARKRRRLLEKTVRQFQKERSRLTGEVEDSISRLEEEG